MSDGGRIRICVSTGELEVEGSAEFVGQYSKAIQEALERLRDNRTRTSSGGGKRDEPAGAGEFDQVDFGEVLHSLQKGSTGSDQILVAGWYLQKSSTDSSFTTSDANKLLVEQGVKLSNASQSLRGNLVAKRVFKVAGNRWRISKQGDEHLKTLMGTKS